MTVSEGEPRGVSWVAVGAGFVVLTLLALVAGAYVSLRAVRYEGAAALHLPPGAQAALRLDAAHARLKGPVRAHLLPLLDERVAGAGQGAAPSRRRQLEGRTGVNLERDLRELLLFSGPRPGDWGVVLGGFFPRRGVVQALAAVLEAEGTPIALVPGAPIASSTSGFAVGQAEDGALIVASSAEIVRAALPRQAGQEELGVAPTEPGSFVARRSFVTQALAGLPAGPAGAELPPFDEVRGDLIGSPELVLEARVLPEPTRRDPALAGAPRLLGTTAQRVSDPVIVAAIGEAHATQSQDGTVVVRWALTDERIDRLMRALAGRLRSSRGASDRGPAAR